MSKDGLRVEGSEPRGPRELFYIRNSFYLCFTPAAEPVRNTCGDGK